jgi:hypothetical protein
MRFLYWQVEVVAPSDKCLGKIFLGSFLVALGAGFLVF